MSSFVAIYSLALQFSLLRSNKTSENINKILNSDPIFFPQPFYVMLTFSPFLSPLHCSLSSTRHCFDRLHMHLSTNFIINFYSKLSCSCSNLSLNLLLQTISLTRHRQSVTYYTLVPFPGF